MRAIALRKVAVAHITVLEEAQNLRLLFLERFQLKRKRGTSLSFRFFVLPYAKSRRTFARKALVQAFFVERLLHIRASQHALA